MTEKAVQTIYDGCVCQSCGRIYRVDLIVPDEWWNRIRPEGSVGEGGMLCGSCIMDRIEKLGEFNALHIERIRNMEVDMKKKEGRKNSKEIDERWGKAIEGMVTNRDVLIDAINDLFKRVAVLEEHCNHAGVLSVDGVNDD